jgi:hypothetical protein
MPAIWTLTTNDKHHAAVLATNLANPSDAGRTVLSGAIGYSLTQNVSEDC